MPTCYSLLPVTDITFSNEKWYFTCALWPEYWNIQGKKIEKTKWDAFQVLHHSPNARPVIFFFQLIACLPFFPLKKKCSEARVITHTAYTDNVLKSKSVVLMEFTETMAIKRKSFQLNRKVFNLTVIHYNVICSAEQ